jgi:hypothetical protein
VFFLRYVNNVGSEIDGSDLICVSCASMSHVHQICSHFKLLHLIRLELLVL